MREAVTCAAEIAAVLIFLVFFIAEISEESACKRAEGEYITDKESGVKICDWGGDDPLKAIERMAQ